LRRLIERILFPSLGNDGGGDVDTDLNDEAIVTQLQRLFTILDPAYSDRKNGPPAVPSVSTPAREEVPHAVTNGKRNNLRTKESSVPIKLDSNSMGATAGAANSSIPYVAFIGQISFDTTAEDIQTHLHDAGILSADGQAPVVRLLTDPTTGVSRGAAFVELSSAEQLYQCIALHHSMLNGRRINVERSCGGRNKEHRAMKIRQFKEEQYSKVSQAIDRILEEYEERGLIRVDDVSPELRGRMYALPVSTVSKIFSRLCVPGCEQIEIRQLERKILHSERKRQREVNQVEDVENLDESNVELGMDSSVEDKIRETEDSINKMEVVLDSNNDDAVYTSKRKKLR